MTPQDPVASLVEALGSGAVEVVDLTQPLNERTPVIQLPDPGWVAAVHVGEELYANWCNDVIDPSQPQPRIDESWGMFAG